MRYAFRGAPAAAGEAGLTRWFKQNEEGRGGTAAAEDVKRTAGLVRTDANRNQGGIGRGHDGAAGSPFSPRNWAGFRVGPQ